MKQHDSLAAFKKVAVVIPCYNEEASIAEVVAKLPLDALATHGLRVTVYVVDNNSSDNTAAVAKKTGAIVVHEPKQGKGNALRTGFNKVAADTDYVVMLDGDCTYCPEEILRMVEPLRSDFCDVVVGSRLGGRLQPASMSKFNLLGNRLFTMGVRLLYGANVTDVLTGYFAWKKPALDKLKLHIKSPGFAVEMEMITKMARLGFQMTSVPISYQPRTGQSSLHPLKDGFRILKMLLRNLLWRPGQPPAPIRRLPHTVAGETDENFTRRKIVFVSDAIYPYMKGGKEKRLHEISTRLAAMGHDVHIYTMQWWGGSDKVTYEDGVYLHALCKYHEMYSGDRRTIKEGVLFGLACFKLIGVRFDVLDVDHMPFFPIFSTWVVCILRGLKLHATWHEALSRQEWINYMGRSGAIAAFIERLSIRLPHRITAASAHTKEILATVHGRIDGVEIVASGIDTSLMRNVRSAPIDCDVLYVGRLVKDKNVDKLILAVGLLVPMHPELRCVILGHGIEKERLQALVARKKLQHNVTFLDSLSEAADVYAYMKAAKVFCSPSSREGFGIASLEALGCGTPVITINSPINAARHLIQDGQNGSVVSLDTSALAEAISYWTSRTHKPDIANQVADNDWHKLAKKQVEVYML
jgi:glycosyltransferase involved in cell wall biosynthesis